MFVVLLRYIKPMEEINKHVAAHRAFLDKYYASGNLIVSGRMNPPAGGVIICVAQSREAVEAIMAQDPFNLEKIAEYSIYEFEPNKMAEGFKHFLS